MKLKKLLLVLMAAVMLLTGCGSSGSGDTDSPREVNLDLIQSKGGYYYVIDEDKPFTGTAISYGFTWQKFIESKTQFVNGILQGEFTSYYEKGGLESKGQYKDGLEDGLWIIYYENGNVKREWEYSYGSYNGKCNHYYEDGQPEITGQYKYGKPDGIWIEYYSDGTVKKKQEWKDGKIVY